MLNRGVVMNTRRLLLPLLGAAVTIALAAHSAATAQAIDPHKLYEERCASCHLPHAGEFARTTLMLDGGLLKGKESNRAVADILTRHARRTYTPAEIEALINLLAPALQSGGVFEQKCLFCHDRAVAFARSHLVVRDGRLTGRYSGHDISAFLPEHGRMTEEEVAVVIAMLRRQIETKVH
jgi:cytochrome c5